MYVCLFVWSSLVCLISRSSAPFLCHTAGSERERERQKETVRNTQTERETCRNRCRVRYFKESNFPAEHLRRIATNVPRKRSRSIRWTINLLTFKRYSTLGSSHPS